MKMVKLLLATLFTSLVLVPTISFFPSFANAEKLLSIKYRDTLVDVDKPHFEHLDTSKSSFMRDAWYDMSQKYLVINLKGINYQHCGMDEQTWAAFKAADSFGRFYNAQLRGRFDCRINPVGRY